MGRIRITASRTVASAAVCSYVTRMSMGSQPLQKNRRSFGFWCVIVLALLIAWTSAAPSFHGPRGAPQTQLPTADFSGASHQKAVRLSHAFLLQKSQQPLTPGGYPPSGLSFGLAAQTHGNWPSHLCDRLAPATERDCPSFIRLRTRNPRDPPTETAVTHPLTA